MPTGLTSTVATTWDYATALHAYRQTAARISVWWERQDCFDKPSLQRADIRAADQAVQVAFAARDGAAVAGALEAWERAICGEAFVVHVCTR